MARFLLAPRWLLFHVVIVAAVVSFIVLGSWQFSAYRDSNARHDTRNQDPVSLTEVASVGEPIDDAVDMPVTIAGMYMADLQRLVPGRIHNNVLGSFVLTPLETSDGVIVPVVRGWIDSPDDPQAAVPEGQVTVTGHLLPPETPDHATVRSDRPLEPDQVGYVAPHQVADAIGVDAESLLQGYVLLNAQDPVSENSPEILNVDVVAPIRHVNPWQNLSYWAQWWVFAIAAVVFWFSAVRSALRRRRADGVTEPEQSHVPT